MNKDTIIHTYLALMKVVVTVIMLITAGCADKEVSREEPDLLSYGWSRYRIGEYEQAIATFDTLLARRDLEADIRLNALYGKAVTLDLRQPVPSQNNELASNLYHQIMSEAPASDAAAWSSLALARMLHLVPVDSEPDYDAVRVAYQHVIDQYPDHLAGQEALIYQQSTVIMQLDPSSSLKAIARLRQFVEEFPDSSFVTAAYNLLAQGYETTGEYDLQMEARIRELETLEIDPSSPAASDLSWRYWQLATTAEYLTGRFDIARVYYQKLINEYPLDFRKFAAKQALLRMDGVEQRLREEIGL
jgi:tetratricopeptide (TPR) repeat protein